MNCTKKFYNILFFADLEKKKFKQAEKRSKETIDEAKSYDENDLANKQEILATLYSLQGIAQLEQGKLAAAEASFKKDFEISDEMWAKF